MTLRRFYLLLVLVPSLGCPAGPSPSATMLGPAAGPPLFEEITTQCGIDFAYINGENADHYSILESLGGGLALIDFDQDGRLDVFVPGGGSFEGPDRKQIVGRAGRMYRNLGQNRFRDVSGETGLDRLAFYSHGAVVGDYDADGWPDLLVTGYGHLTLFRNEAGASGRLFRDVSEEAGLKDGNNTWTTSAAFGDLDGDGFPELYVCQYVNWSFANHPACEGNAANVKRDVCSPRRFDALPHRLFHNLGRDKRGMVKFRDVSAEAGLRVPPRDDRDYGKGLGVLFVDLNGDFKPDIYVANDTTDNFLYLNESEPGRLRFRERGFECLVARDGTGQANGSMGVDAADYDGSGLPSLWVVNFEGEPHGLYRNALKDGRLWFRFSTQTSGIAAIGQNFVGFGTAFLDFDRDGWQDLVISNGHVLRHPARSGEKQRPVLLRNQGDGRFLSASDRGGSYFQRDHRGRGLAVGDLDNDGGPDLLFSPANEPAAVLRHAGGPEHWLGLELVRPDHRDVVGARVTVETATRKLVRFAKGGGSYLSSSDRRILVGLGSEEQVKSVTVEWPNGEPRKQTFDVSAVDRYWRAVQDEAALQDPQSKP